MAAAKVTWRAVWLLVITVLLLGGCGQAGDPSTEPVHEDVPAAEIPTLSAADVAEADRIISELPTALPDLDKTLLDLLTTVPYEEQGPWHSGRDYRLIGVTRQVILPEPLTLGPVSFPGAAWDEATDDYTPFTFHYDSIVGLRTVSILIDLKLGRVVGIQPDEAKKINPSDKTKFPEVEDGGLG